MLKLKQKPQKRNMEKNKEVFKPKEEELSETESEPESQLEPQLQPELEPGDEDGEKPPNIKKRRITNEHCYIRAVYWHEEGVYAHYRTWKVPKKLPKSLDSSLAFLKDLVPTSKRPKKVNLRYRAHDGYGDPQKDQETAFTFFSEGAGIWHNESTLTFDYLMSQVCGPAVKRAYGYIYQVMVPTF